MSQAAGDTGVQNKPATGGEHLKEPGTGDGQPPKPEGEKKPEGGGGDGEKAWAAQIRKLEEKLSKLQEGLEAANQAAIHWHEQFQQATAGGDKRGKPKAANADDDGGDGDEPEEVDLIEVVTTGGVKALAKVLRKHGFITEAEAEKRAEAIVKKARTEMDLHARYPDLADQESEMFRETAKQYKALGDNGLTKAERLEVAAEKAELALRRAGKWRDKQQDEQERAARAAAQSGDRGRGSGEPGANDDDSLTPHQKRIAAAMGVSEDAYKKRAKDGVQFSMPRR